MALTKITAKSVKDDAITTEQIAHSTITNTNLADDSCTQAKIADEAVDEARLQISNAGSNGQFLQKQSGNTGGLTWAAANEYTHPNHSGEVTSTADGAQVIADNVVDEANLKVSNSPTNGQLLSAQSGNTGGLTWTDPPASAPQIEVTADGAITAGKTCIITTAGKAKQVAAAPVATNPVIRNSGSEASKSGTGGEYLQGTYAECVAYDPDSDTVAVALREDGNGNAKFYLFSTSGDNLTYHTVERVLDSNSTRSGSMSITALPGRRYLGTYYDSANSGTTKCVILTVNSNGDGWSAGSTTALKGNGCYTDAIFGIHTTGGRVALAVRGTGTGSLTNGRMALICGDCGTTGSTWTYRSFSDNIFGESTSYCISLDYDSTNDVIGVQAGNGSLMEIIGMRIASGTSATISKGTKYTLTTSTLNDSRHICKHISGTTWVSQWAAGTNGPIYLNTTAINSSLAISNGSQYSLSGSGNNGGVGLDVTNEGRLLLGWQHNDSVAKVKQYTLSGTTLTALSGEPTILDSITDKDRFAFRYMGHNGKIAAFVTRGGNGLARGTADTTVDGSNMTTENYIGIANSTVSDGATATIDVSGATNSSQSSLTPGQKYYVQADGTLGLTAATPEVFAGTAVAATKIIVNDQQPIPTQSLNEVDEWGQFTGDGNSSYGPWSNLNGQWGNGTNSSRQQGTLTRVSVSGMPKGTGMTNSNGVFTFPSTGKWHITVHMFVQRYDQNQLANITLQLSTNSGSSWLAGPDDTGLCFGTVYIHTTYGTKAIVPLSAIVNVTDTSTYRVRVNVVAGGGNMYMRPGSRITFMKIGE